jgi:Trypsin-co-occurring domain 2
MQIPIADAIHQLREQLRQAILDGRDQDIVFTPNGVEIELGVNFTTEAEAGGGFKIFAVLDMSTKAGVTRESEHKIKLSLSVADRNGNPLKVRSDAAPRDLPR